MDAARLARGVAWALDSDFGVWGLRFRVWGLGFWCLGFRVGDVGHFRVSVESHVRRQP